MATGDSPTEQQLHREIVHLLLELLKQHHYFLKASKCEFEQPEVKFLGFRIKDGELKIDPSKISGLHDWPRELKNVHKVRQTMGVLNYQPFI